MLGDLDSGKLEALMAFQQSSQPSVQGVRLTVGKVYGLWLGILGVQGPGFRV